MLTASIIGVSGDPSHVRSSQPTITKHTEDKRRRPTYHQHKSAEYVLPNDFPEHARLEKQAALLSHLMNGKVLHAPVPDREDALDVGCGTGIITDVISRKYPQAECIGLDLSPVPNIRPRRSNTRFFQGNFVSTAPSQWTPDVCGPHLPRGSGLFDYIFSRLLILGMTDWPGFIKQEVLQLKPGGWAEVHDLAWHWYDQDDNIISQDWRWLEKLGEVCEGQKSMELHCGAKAGQWMVDAGFVDVQTFEYSWPCSPQAQPTPQMRELGEYSTTDVPIMLHHMIARTMGDVADGNEVEEMRSEMRENLKAEKGDHQVFYVTIGRKPE